MTRADVEGARRFRGSFSGFERNRLFVRDGPRFHEAAHGYGLDFEHDGRAVAAFDMDGDGDLDLALLALDGLHVLENRAADERDNHFARVELRASTGPAGVLGATVELAAGGRRYLEPAQLTAGLQTQVSARLHVGLGGAATIERLTVHWPSGHVDTHRGLPADNLLVVDEGAAAPEVKPLARWPERVREGVADIGGDAALLAEDGAGARRPIVPGADGRALVLNLWAPWCAACETEAPALRELASAGGSALEVVSVSVEPDRAKAAAFFARHRLTHPSLFATDALIERLFGAGAELTLPATFVFDPTGSLRRAFYRAVTRAELEAALASETSASRAAPLLGLRELAGVHIEAGAWQEARPLLLRAAALEPEDAELQRMLARVELATADGSPDPAARRRGGLAAASRATQLNPEDDRAWQVLATARWAAGELPAAEEALARGLALAPDSADLWMTRAAVHQAQGRLAEALAAARTAVAAEPARADPHRLLLALLSARGDSLELREARERFERTFPHLVARE